MLNYLIFGISYAFAAAVQPGPLQTYIISQVLKKGWKASIPLAFSPIISDIPISILTLYLLSNVPDIFVNGLRIIGGLFLFFLAGCGGIASSGLIGRGIEKPTLSEDAKHIKPVLVLSGLLTKIFLVKKFHSQYH